MALIDYDSWQVEYESCEKLYSSILEIIREDSAKHNKDRLRTNLNRLFGELSSLNKRLEDEKLDLTTGERIRRRNLLDKLLDKEKALRDKTFIDESQELERRQLLMRTNRSIVDVGPSSNFGDDFHVLSRDEILSEQDKGLDALHEVIVRQKNIASAIGNEVETQNELIDDIGDGIDRTRERLINTTETARRINVKDRTLPYWTVILVCLIVIIILIFVPGKR